MTSLTDTQVITASGGLVELGYAESNANLSISATTGAGMDNISPELTVVCDGSPVMVEFFCATARATTSGSGTTDALWFTLKVDGSVEVERLGTVGNVTTSYGSLTPIKLSHRMTPSAGSHTFRIGGWVSNAARTGYIGGGSPYPPAWIRVSKIVEATQWPAVQTSTIICTSSTRPASPFEGQVIYETDTGLSLIYDGSAWVSPSVTHKPPTALISRVTTQSIPNDTTTAVQFTAEGWDTDDMATLASNNDRLTIKTAGLYLVVANATLDANSTGQREIQIVQSPTPTWAANGYIASKSFNYPTPSSANRYQEMTASVVANCAVNDYFYVNVWQNSGGAMNLRADVRTASLSATWLGQA